MGTPDFAVPILQSIKESNHQILEVYTQPPQKKNRGQKESFTSVYNFSLKNKISVRHPEKLDTIEEINFFKKIKPDVVVVVAYGKIIPKNILDIQNIKFINVHASLLPKWRGAAPIQRSIMNLDFETGISIMKIVPKLDAGPVMLKAKVRIFKETNFEDLSNKLSNLGAKTIMKSLNLIENKKENFENQNESEATYANKIQKNETKINWNEKAEIILAKINALSPTPGSWFNYSESRFKILKAKEVKHNGNAGEIIDPKFVIACSENAIQILEIQKEGKKKMNIEEYLKGNSLILGSNVS